jgi:hypothetical protein
MPQVAPGRYEATVPVQDDGVYALNVSQTNSDTSVANQPGGFVVPYSPEYRVLDADDGLLERIAKQTGSRLITDPDRAFVHDLPSVGAPRPVWPLLLVIAALLFVLDIGVRRVRITSHELRAAYYAVRRRLGYTDIPSSLERDSQPDVLRARLAVRVPSPSTLVETDANPRLHVRSPEPGPAVRSSRLLAAKQRASRR